MSYCLDVNRGKLTCRHKYYHDNIYGFPVKMTMKSLED